ncbi:unnamed protein product [Acanthoscelides obtectus]|uniref:Uncharacterized protein n=1 Tax=Acanthoscelides obtectus TaxID=200917 RepID=A0A9P0LTF0_ACAOB|nr:unnamed protein product [Acanthoscelides obtectus]CAK1664150.1 hypothetical protein AOBTE_LOCUS24083 [Acanthoscelides obtectus]
MHVANMRNRLQDAPGAEAIERRQLVHPKKRRPSYQQPVLSPVTEMSTGNGCNPCPSRGWSPESPPWNLPSGMSTSATYGPSGSPCTDHQMKNIMDSAAQQQGLLDQEKFGMTQFYTLVMQGT